MELVDEISRVFEQFGDTTPSSSAQIGQESSSKEQKDPFTEAYEKRVYSRRAGAEPTKREERIYRLGRTKFELAMESVAKGKDIREALGYINKFEAYLKENPIVSKGLFEEFSILCIEARKRIKAKSGK